jgi:hypothetical protein
MYIYTIKMMLYIGLFVLVMVIVGAVLVYLNKDKLFKKKVVKAKVLPVVKEDEGPVVNITEDGSSIEEYRTGRENYMVFPRVEESVSPYPVYAYNPNDSNVGNSLMGSDETWNTETGKCPDGTLDCLYYERVTDGRVTAITDKNGKDLIKTFVDDFWDGKLTVFDENMTVFDEAAQLNEGGQLTFSGPDGETMIAKPGVNATTGMFLVMLMVKLKQKYPDTKPVIKIDMPAKTVTEFDEFFKAMNQLGATSPP